MDCSWSCGFFTYLFSPRSFFKLDIRFGLALWLIRWLVGVRGFATLELLLEEVAPIELELFRAFFMWESLRLNYYSLFYCSMPKTLCDKILYRPF